LSALPGRFRIVKRMSLSNFSGGFYEKLYVIKSTGPRH
jgi:hypothetical protein